MADPPPGPRLLTVEHGPSHLIMRWRWRAEESFHWLIAALTVLGMLTGVLSFDLSPLLALDAPRMRPFGVVVLLCLLYVILACLLNYTEVSVRQGVLEVRHHPLPWWPRRVLPSDDVTQLFCRESLEHNDQGHPTHESYSVHLKLRNGSALRLTGGL